MSECDWHGGARVRHPAEILDRCGTCGHRLETDGLKPVQTRSLPVRYWPVELQRRRWATRRWRVVRATWDPPGL